MLGLLHVFILLVLSRVSNIFSPINLSWVIHEGRSSKPPASAPSPTPLEVSISRIFSKTGLLQPVFKLILSIKFTFSFAFLSAKLSCQASSLLVNKRLGLLPDKIIKPI
ncbi:MAG: hypothetical protein COV52_06500 [Gammaproteobacteria bacterium CG11_big_fil_rev_8_21_14_0_20_46_22]|nr:MAG: hypothetical protein COV52_06500 [Gammaproteobacteria bacterium CG11_big_fil_rev_8_21_14_0_20_46_22]